MSITDVMSQLTAMQQLATQLATPPAPVGSGTPSSFADVLNAATGATSSSSGAALDAASPSATSTASASGTGASGSSLSEATVLSTILEQSQAQSLLGSLDSSDSSDGLSSLDSLSSLLPTLSAATAATTAAPAAASSAAPSVAGAAPLDATTTTPTTLLAPNTSGERVLTAAQSQLGVSEQPPGSNNGPQIATYRAAVAGSQPGEPWCADFASWAAAQAGEPLGPAGQGFSSVAELTDWAASSGRLLPASATPAPGDLILFGDHHVGIVESVNPDGSLTTVEGNYANAVSQVHRSPSEATGYVQM